jgi:hypothetical protein
MSTTTLEVTPASTLLPTRARVQASLRVGAIDDPLERQADEVADRVMRMPDPGLAVLRRCPGGCPPSGCHEFDPRLQRRVPEGGQDVPAAAGSTRAAPPAVRETLRSIGRPMDGQTRRAMEARFGHRFDDVRIHADASAARSTQLVNARAFTVGAHIAFAAGAYAPRGTAGQRLLAHELAHVLQQRRATRPEPHTLQRAEPATTVTIGAVAARCIIGAITGALFDAGIQSVLHSIRERTWRFWQARYDYCSIILSAIIGCIAGPVSAYILEPWITAQLGARLGGMAGPLIGKILLFIAKKLGMAIPKSLVGALAKLGCISPEQAAELNVRPGAEEETSTVS